MRAGIFCAVFGGGWDGPPSGRARMLLLQVVVGFVARAKQLNSESSAILIGKPPPVTHAGRLSIAHPLSLRSHTIRPMRASPATRRTRLDTPALPSCSSPPLPPPPLQHVTTARQEGEVGSTTRAVIGGFVAKLLASLKASATSAADNAKAAAANKVRGGAVGARVGVTQPSCARRSAATRVC